VQIYQAEVDDSGYDIVLTLNGITRHIQLKTSHARAKTAWQDIILSLLARLAAALSGCSMTHPHGRFRVIAFSEAPPATLSPPLTALMSRSGSSQTAKECCRRARTCAVFVVRTSQASRLWSSYRQYFSTFHPQFQMTATPKTIRCIYFGIRRICVSLRFHRSKCITRVWRVAQDFVSSPGVLHGICLKRGKRPFTNCGRTPGSRLLRAECLSRGTGSDESLAAFCGSAGIFAEPRTSFFSTLGLSINRSTGVSHYQLATRDWTSLCLKLYGRGR
jgi:hypothetical protein